MGAKIKDYKRYLFIGITTIALGITFSTTMRDRFGSLGTVFIAVGGLFFIIGMSKRKNENNNSE